MPEERGTVTTPKVRGAVATPEKWGVLATPEEWGQAAPVPERACEASGPDFLPGRKSGPECLAGTRRPRDLPRQLRPAITASPRRRHGAPLLLRRPGAPLLQHRHEVRPAGTVAVLALAEAAV